MSSKLCACFFTVLWALSCLFSNPVAGADSKTRKRKQPITELEKITKPVEEAVSKTAETALKEAQQMVKEAHSLGQKFLQGIINVMTAASPGKTRVYLPAVGSDPNSGVTAGFLPVFLFVKDSGEIQHILAPSVTYNKLFGVNATMRHYWYPHKGAQLFTIGTYVAETNRRITLRYEDRRFFSEKYYLKFDFTAQRDGSFRFFGLGPRSSFQSQSNYTMRHNHLQIYTGINIPRHFRVTASHRLRYANVINGPISSIPRISDYSPRPAGVEDPKTIVTQGLAASFDTRDSVAQLVRGWYFNLYSEFAGHLGGDAKYDRVGADLRAFQPLSRNRFVTAWRFLLEGENGGEKVPFYERALLGGRDSLRGFGEARFVDHNKISLSVEERILLYTLHAFNVNVNFEITPFYETGAVYNRRDSLRLTDLHHVGGVGFRSVVRPNVVGVVDLGFSSEGTALFVGIDYPF